MKREEKELLDLLGVVMETSTGAITKKSIDWKASFRSNAELESAAETAMEFYGIDQFSFSFDKRGFFESFVEAFENRHPNSIPVTSTMSVEEKRQLARWFLFREDLDSMAETLAGLRGYFRGYKVQEVCTLEASMDISSLLLHIQLEGETSFTGSREATINRFLESQILA